MHLYTSSVYVYLRACYPVHSNVSTHVQASISISYIIHTWAYLHGFQGFYKGFDAHVYAHVKDFQKMPWWCSSFQALEFNWLQYCRAINLEYKYTPLKDLTLGTALEYLKY